MATMRRAVSSMFLLVSVIGLGCQDSSRGNAPELHAPVVEASANADAAAAATATLSDAGFATEKVTGEGHAMGTHLGYAAYTNAKCDAGAAHR
ncbi:MAG: hypothetical protein ABI461_09920, partial [Polyangiaceae bacterium]